MTKPYLNELKDGKWLCTKCKITAKLLYMEFVTMNVTKRGVTLILYSCMINIDDICKLH